MGTSVDPSRPGRWVPLPRPPPRAALTLMDAGLNAGLTDGARKVAEMPEPRSCRHPLTDTLSHRRSPKYCVPSLWLLGQLEQTRWLKQHTFILLYFWGSEVQSGSHRAEIQVLARLCSLWGLQGEWRPFPAALSASRAAFHGRRPLPLRSKPAA